MLSSLLFYIIMFLLSVFFITRVDKIYNAKKISEKKYKIITYSVLGLVIPILISGLRYEVGTDYYTYTNLYKQCIDLNYIQVSKKGVEVTFYIIAKMASIFNTHQLLFVIYSIITIGFIYKSIFDKREKISISLCFFLYLFLEFTTSMNIIRQAAAIAIIAYAYKYIEDRKIVKFAFFTILATLFHTTALLVLPFYFILVKPKKYKKNTKVYRILFTILIIVILLDYERIILFLSNSIPIFSKFGTYIEGEKNTRNLVVIQKIILLMTLLPFRKKMIKYNEKNELYYFLLIIDLLLSFTGFISPYIKRIALYFQVSQLYILAGLPKIFKEKKVVQTTTIIIIAYAISIFVLTVYILGQGNLIPYKTIWGGFYE